jgi:ferrous iron transport protein B
MGRAVQPIFDLAGFDWKITVGVVASFPAREVIIATLGVIYSLGGEVDEASGDLRSAMAAERWGEGPRAGTPVYTLAVAFAIMVFFALCQQCGATVAVVAQETNWRWAAFSFCYMTALAWLGAVAVYQIGSRLGWG